MKIDQAERSYLLRYFICFIIKYESPLANPGFYIFLTETGILLTLPGAQASPFIL